MEFNGAKQPGTVNEGVKMLKCDAAWKLTMHQKPMLFLIFAMSKAVIKGKKKNKKKSVYNHILHWK